MSEAGRSAGVEAARLVALANAYDERAALARAEAERWMIGHRTERQVAGTLAPLSACGYTFLHDRGWPGARRGSRSQIDHVLVGPGGVFVVDTKGWKDVTVAGGRIFRGQADVTDDRRRTRRRGRELRGGARRAGARLRARCGWSWCWRVPPVDPGAASRAWAAWWWSASGGHPRSSTGSADA